MSARTALGLSVLSILLVADPVVTLAGDDKPPAGMCRRVSDAGYCTCSLAKIETELTFGEAAGLIELYFYEYPDESYIEFLSSLLRQCSRTSPNPVKSPEIILRQDNQTALVR